MMNTHKQRISALLAAGMVAVSGFGLVMGTAGTAFGQDSETKGSSEKDTILLRNGTVLEGRILGETATEIEFEVVVAGITGKRTVERSQILSITRAAGETKPATGTKNNTSKPTGGTPSTATAETGPKIYMIPWTGEFQRDVNLTPMRRVMEDAKKVQPDIIIIKVDCDFKIYGEEQQDWQNQPGSFDQLEIARQLDPMITDAIREDPQWKVKPRLVFWVRKALGGSAFMPFITPEIYYTSDAKHGGIGYLDYLFAGVGDEVVREKQRSLRLARAEGIALKGGHPAVIVRAMARVDQVLSVNFVGGKPEFHEDTSGEVLLTDDGSTEAGTRDTVDEILRFNGNDVLTLTADMAERLGISKGTVDTETQLFEKLGITRVTPQKVGKAEAILEEWSKGVAEAEFTIRRLARDLERVEVKAPGGWTERAQARGRQKSIIKDILAYLEKYKESINPRNIGADPNQLITQLKLTIDGIEQEQRRDKQK